MRRLNIPSVLGLIILIAFCAAHTSPCFCQGNATEKPVYVVFRYDDYAANSVTAAELKIMEAFRKHDIPITFGVIPFKVAGDVEDPAPRDLLQLDSVKAEMLRTGYLEGTLDISMHGYSHQTNSPDYLSEFAHLDYRDQVNRLSEGKEYLEDLTGARVITFLPPWNTYDMNTLAALEESGFTVLSANKKGLVAEGSALHYLPVSCDMIELKDAVKAARKSRDKQPLVVALLHDYDFLDINDVNGVITYREFSDLIDWVSAQEDVEVISISQAREVITDLSAERALRTKRLYYPEKLPPLSLGSSTLLYRESSGFAISLLKIAAFYAVFIVMGLMLLRWLRKVWNL
jgi:peptidoglycan/xylan/chitin deacetylase (PgdA/CDA1 family)